MIEKHSNRPRHSTHSLVVVHCNQLGACSLLKPKAACLFSKHYKLIISICCTITGTVLNDKANLASNIFYCSNILLASISESRPSLSPFLTNGESIY